MGARRGIVVAATHAVLLGGAREKLTAEPIGDIFVTDTVDQPTAAWPRLQVVSVAPLLAQAIQRVTSR
jgi:ribose-phosphate pyrophosphokinase